jgi:glycosyltransferase involved in cell wall biosynthesis
MTAPSRISGQRLAVALCTYNGGRYLPDQLESLARQTRLPDELVICDDRSSDDTLAIARAFGRRAPFEVRILEQDANVGSTKNFETAIRACRGDLIALCDQDDVWHPQKLARSEHALLSAPGADVVFSDATIVDERLRPCGGTLWEGLGFDSARRARINSGAAFELLFAANVVTGATMLFRAGVLGYVLPIPTTVVHDGWIALLVSAISSITIVDEPLMDYRQHAANQIGVRRPHVGQRLLEARRLGQRTASARVLEWCELVQARLERLGIDASRPDVAALVRERCDHMRVRAGLSTSRTRRIVPIARELIGGRYSRFSAGLRSAAVDLVL